MIEPSAIMRSITSTPRIGAHDGERPVVVLTDTSGRHVGVLGREVRAVKAAGPRPLMAFL